MSIYDINGSVISSVYDVNGNVISSVYDVDGNLLDGIVFADETTITNIYTSSITSQPQGGCVDDDGNIYACLYESGKFIKYNLSTGIETVITPPEASGSQPWGHANGMAYNPNTGYLYLASMKTTGEVYVFDTSCNLVDTLYARNESNNIFTCWNIAYDRTRQRFIIINGNKMYFMGDNLNYISHVTVSESQIWPYTAQDIETDGNFVYGVGYNPNSIAGVSMSGDLVKMISNTAFTGEPESMCYDWINDKYYIEGKSSNFVIREAVFKE